MQREAQVFIFQLVRQLEKRVDIEVSCVRVKREVCMQDKGMKGKRLRFRRP